MPGPIHLLDEGGHGGAFSAANGTSDQDQPVLVLGQQLELGGQAQFVHAPHLGLDDAENDLIAQTLSDDAGPETPSRIGIGEINVSPRGQYFFLVLVEKTHGQPFCIGGSKVVGVEPNRFKSSKTTPDWRHVNREMDVGGIGFRPRVKVHVHVGQGMDRLGTFGHHFDFGCDFRGVGHGRQNLTFGTVLETQK